MFPWRRGQWWTKQGAELEQNYLDGCIVFNGITYSVGMSLSKLWEVVKDREAWPSLQPHAAVHGVAKSQTRLTDWTTTNVLVTFCFWVDSGVLIL